MLLQEFDPNPTAVINPAAIHQPIAGCPRTAVSCFERSAFGRMVERLGGKPFAQTSCANLEIPVYRAAYKGKEIALYESYVGAAGCGATACGGGSVSAKRMYPSQFSSRPRSSKKPW